MTERFQTYFEQLDHLSCEELDRQALALSRREKLDCAELIAHLAEICERGYDLTLGYANLFEYCIRRLNLSEGAVHRRTQVAGVCRRYPQLLEAIAEGRLHLTGASLIAPCLTAENVDRLIAMAEGKTKRELDRLLAVLFPKKPFEPSVRKQPARAPATGELPVAGEHTDSAGTETAAPTPAQASAPPPAQRTRDIVEPATEDRYNFRFSAGTEFTEKFHRLAEVLGIPSPHRHVEEILGQAIEIALEKKDPQRREERRRKRDARKQSARPDEAPPSPAAEEKAAPLEAETSQQAPETSQQAPETSQQAPETSQQAPEAAPPARRIPTPVKDRVLERAGHRCEYRGPDGRRCTERTGLEVEHTRPFAVFQSHDERYLKAYCPAHNKRAAEEYYGRDFIREKIEARRRATAEAAVPGGP